MFVLVVAALVAATPYSARDISMQGFGNECTPAGTWYGSNDYANLKYLLTIVPTRAGRFSVWGHPAFATEPLEGPSVITHFSGEIMKKKGRIYKIRIILLQNFDVTNFPPVETTVIFAVEGVLEFVNCDEIKIRWDFYERYNWRVPFDGPGDIPAPPVPIYETYYRMPMD